MPLDAVCPGALAAMLAGSQDKAQAGSLSRQETTASHLPQMTVLRGNSTEMGQHLAKLTQPGGSHSACVASPPTA